MWKGVTELLYEPVRKAKLIIWITILRQKVQLNFNFFLPRDDIDICTRGTSHGVLLSLSVFVTGRCSTKTDKHRITSTKPHDSSGSLVFWCQ